MMKFKIIFLTVFIVSQVAYGAVPVGYYNSLTGKSDAQLKTALHHIICQDTTQYLKYGSGVNSTWNGFYSSDRDTITNAILDMYSSTLRYFPQNYVALNYPGFGQTVHIEHSVPRSWWNSSSTKPDCAAEDLNQLFPADGSMNSSKSDYPLGVVTGTITKDNGVSKVGNAVYDGYVGKVFEPANSYKGDFARAYFYMATAYQHYVAKWDVTKPVNMMDANTYPTLKPWAINLLLDWSRLDPVSEKELIRVEKVYKIQKNRNPYIDYPELIEYIWGNKKGQSWGIKTDNFNPEMSVYKILIEQKDKSLKVIANDDTLIYIAIYGIDGKMIFNLNVKTNTNIALPSSLKGVYVFKMISKNGVISEKYIF